MATCIVAAMPEPEGRGPALENLRVWKRALDVMVECHLLSRRLPVREHKRLCDQLERSSSAISANIAEGHGRGRPREFLRSLDIARGELREVQTHITSAVRLGYLEDSDVQAARSAVEDVARMLAGLRKSIIKRNDPDG